jgi:hypothetical protein
VYRRRDQAWPAVDLSAMSKYLQNAFGVLRPARPFGLPALAWHGEFEA